MNNPSGNTVSEELLNMLECSICLSLMVEPVTIGCGHTFCKPCLVQSLQRHARKCPTCRAICHVSAEDAPVNSTMKHLALYACPEQFERRRSEFESERLKWTTLSPIFYCDEPVFPNGHLSLHLLEPRYQVMIQRILNSSRTFTYLPANPSSAAAAGDNTIALQAILKEVEVLPGGRCLVEAKLGARVKVLEQFEEDGTHGLRYCRVEPYFDLPISCPSKTDELSRIAGEAAALCSILLSQIELKKKIEAYHGLPVYRDLEAFSLWLCGVCVVNESDKLAMLRSQDTLVRMQIGLLALQQLVTRVRRCTERANGCPMNTSVTSSAHPHQLQQSQQQH